MIGKETFEYDAFISHAVEDKMPIANELCARLERAGLRIWYSGRELRVGDRLTDTIEEGLSKSRFGIVILSPTYISKTWTLREFYSLLSREKDGRKVILPVLYDITPEELARKDLTMAEMFALRAEKGMDHVLEVLVSEISQIKKKERRRDAFRILTDIRSIISMLAVLAMIMMAWIRWQERRAEDTLLTPGIITRLDDIAHRAGTSFLAGKNNTAVTVQTVSAEYTSSNGLQGYYRTEYRIVADDGRLHYKKHVEERFEVKHDSVRQQGILHLTKTGNGIKTTPSTSVSFSSSLFPDSLLRVENVRPPSAKSHNILALALESLLDDENYFSFNAHAAAPNVFGVAHRSH